MPRKLDIVGPREIANRLDVTHQLVSQWMKRGWPAGKRGAAPVKSPKAIAVVSGVTIFHWKDVETWAIATGRLTRSNPGARG